MSKLRIASDLSLPLDAVTQKLGWIGTSGSGKTYGATKLAELFWDAGAQFVALDPVGVWYGLRLDADGKRPSNITIPIFGGLHGDVPIQPESGAQLANLIVDRGISAILDVSQFESDAAKARFAADFGDRFFFRKKSSPSAVHLFVEECQEFIPEHQQRGEERMLHVFTRIQKIGRNFGIGSSLITQRPQEVAKKAVNLAQTLFVFRATGAHERASIERWIKDKAIEGQDVSSELPKLKTGAPHVWSPEWLEMSRVIKILEKRTYNASATPEVGAKAATRDLAPIDLEKIKTDMVAAIEKAKADDPKELRKRIADLERERSANDQKRSVVSSEMIVEEYQRGLADGEIRGRHGAMVDFRAIVNRDASAVDRAITGLLTANDIVVRTWRDLRSSLTPTQTEIDAKRQVEGLNRVRATPKVPTTIVPTAVLRMAKAETNGTVTGVEQRILNTLKALEEMGVSPVDKPTAAALVGYHPNAKSYSNALGSLRSAGRVDYPGGGEVALTPEGRAIAVSQLSIASVDDLHRIWFERLGNVAQRILEPVIKAYRNGEKAVDTDVLAESAGYHPNAKSFANMKGRLRTLGLIDYPSSGKVIATKVLFPEGLY